MQIQWYPGHMHKASKEIKLSLPQIDLIIEVLDARIPFSSSNPMLSTLRGDKPCIRLLNKHDLADPVRTSEWQDYLEREHQVKTLAVTKQQPETIRRLIELCHKMLADKAAAGKIIRTMIMGIPNVGKSSIINILAGRNIAKTGNEPAVTKGQQRINLPGNLVLSDTPGVLWPNVENKHSGYRLAATGAIKDTAIDHDDVAFFTAEFLLKHYPEKLKQRYQITELPADEATLMEMIGHQRGCLRTGRQVDLDKTGKLLLRELRNGALGRITLETPAMMEAELLEVAEIRAQREAKKAARKQRRKNARD